jgi:hypothetical protein
MERMPGDGERASGADTSVDDERAPSLRQRVLNFGGLLLIAAVFVVLMLRTGGRGSDAGGSTGFWDVGSDGTASSGGDAASDGNHSLTMVEQRRDPLPPLMLPYDPAVPDREPLAGLPGAVERFGGSFTIRHPTYLPADVVPFTVNWQPDVRPNRRAEGSGELFTWFYSAEHGAVLLLAQGPGAGVWPLTADDRRAGRVRLVDGTEAVWVIGHPMSVTGSVAGRPMWEGTEITIGVPANDGGGWYLTSPIVNLEEMIRVANSLQPVQVRQ